MTELEVESPVHVPADELHGNILTDPIYINIGLE